MLLMSAEDKQTSISLPHQHCSIICREIPESKNNKNFCITNKLYKTIYMLVFKTSTSYRCSHQNNISRIGQ